MPAWILIGVRFPDSIVTPIGDFLGADSLPEGWEAMPPTLVSQSIGDRWLESARSAVLRVPSVVVPAESNYLLNPRHPDFDRIEIAAPEVLRVDPRLI